MAGYILDQTWELEEQRLEALERCSDPLTIACLERLGVGPGWRCLEVGAGRGSIARWLAERVAADGGGVVAVDLDTTLLEESGGPALEVRRLDIRSDPLPQAEFDLVHARHVLGHLHDREEVLGRLATTLRPGGVVLIEDFDWHWRRLGEWPCAHTDHGVLVARVWGAALDVMRAGTYDGDWARRLPSVIGAAGLVGVGGEVRAAIGDEGFARCMHLTVLRFREEIAATGVGAEDVDRYLDLLADPAACVTVPLTFSVWGRRPPG